MKRIILILGTVLLLVGAVTILWRISVGKRQNQAVLKINSNPTATVFLDNQNLGKTPYNEKVSPGEFTIKLIPESTVDSVVSWETKIKLNPGMLTYISRDLSSTELTSGGEILTLEKINGKKSELAVISNPDGARVNLANEDKGVTPLVIQDLDSGSYELAVSSVGFGTRSVKIKATAGFKLNAAFYLPLTGEAPEASPSLEPSPTSSSTKPSPKSSPKSTPVASASATPKAKSSPPPKPYIEVLNTPTDFLNVRKEPSLSAEILTKIYPGEFYSLLDEDTEGKWYKIEHESDKEGWVSSQYAKKFE